LAHPARVSTRELVEPRLQPEGPQPACSEVLRLGSLVDERVETRVFGQGQVFVQRRLVGHEHERVARFDAGGKAAADLDVTTSWQETDKGAEQGALACPVGADQ